MDRKTSSPQPEATELDIQPMPNNLRLDPTHILTIPWELRREILVRAFGDRRLHLDLFYDHPMIPITSRKGMKARTHAAVNSFFDPVDEKRRMRVDWSVPRRLIWTGSECHCMEPGRRWYHDRFYRHLLARTDATRGHPSEAAWEDECHLGAKTHCQHYPGPWPLRCQIGVVGWLLSCRQARDETMEVLFGTNDFRISGLERRLPLPTNVPVTLPGMAFLTNLDLIVSDYSPTPRPDLPSGVLDITSFARVLRDIMTGCPRLRRLFVYFSEQAKDRDVRRPLGNILGIVDACYVHRPPTLSSFTLGLDREAVIPPAVDDQDALYGVVQQDDQGGGGEGDDDDDALSAVEWETDDEEEDAMPPQQIPQGVPRTGEKVEGEVQWRSLDGEPDVICMLAPTYPEPPPVEQDQEDQEDQREGGAKPVLRNGYWILVRQPFQRQGSGLVWLQPGPLRGARVTWVTEH